MTPFVKEQNKLLFQTNYSMTNPFAIITGLFIMLIVGIALLDAVTYNYKYKKRK